MPHLAIPRPSTPSSSAPRGQAREPLRQHRGAGPGHRRDPRDPPLWRLGPGVQHVPRRPCWLRTARASSRIPSAGHGSTTETIAPRAITTRVVTLLSTIGMFVVATRLVIPADESTDTSATAGPSPDSAEALAPLARSPDPPLTDPQPARGCSPKGMPRETPPPPAEAPAAAATDEPKDMTRETPPPPAEAARQPAPHAAAPRRNPEHAPRDSPAQAEAKPRPPVPEPLPEAKQPPPAPQTPPPPSRGRSRASRTARRGSEIAQQLKYLRATCA